MRWPVAFQVGVELSAVDGKEHVDGLQLDHDALYEEV
jgi:hypothetical protein